MSILNDLSKDTVIFISGTPCTGKTTVASDLNDYLSSNGFHSRLIKVNDFAIENDLVLGEDPDKFYKVIDIDGLNECLNEEISQIGNSILIVEGHLSHLCEGADKMIVLRLNPSILKDRLEERNYSESKIQENLEAEALAVCSAINSAISDCVRLKLTHVIRLLKVKVCPTNLLDRPFTYYKITTLLSEN